MIPIPYEQFRVLVWIVGVPLIAFLVWQISRRLRAIRELDERLRKEEAESPKNPYAEMAKMYEVQEILDKNRLFGRFGGRRSNGNAQSKETDAPIRDR